MLFTLRVALLLGTVGYSVFILFNVLSKELSTHELLDHLPMVLILSGLLCYLHAHPRPQAQISRIVKFGSGAAMINLCSILLVEGNPALYVETWTSLLPIYFFIYGQLFMPIAETLILGWLAMLILPLCGYWIGVETSELRPSLLILLIVNLFGFCTRFQLESHARHSFMARRKAENAAEDKTVFLMQLSHNLRQPLQALSCYSSTLEAACNDHSTDRMEHLIRKMSSTIDELNKAIDHTLEISRLEIGQHPPILKSVDINVLLASLEDRFVTQAAKHGLRLEVHLRRSPPYAVNSDAVILSQIISNLIDNAIKYTTNGWIIISAIHIGGDRLKLHVRDSGIGIPEEMQTEIFKEFVRGNRRQNDLDQPMGMGMGLAYVLKATNSLPDHQLKVYSQQHRGSNFQLYLPVTHSKQPQINIQQTATNQMNCFVVIVDNDRQVLNALAAQLTGWGCLVQTASCMAEIRANIGDNLITPDLLISEYHFGNGETVLDAIASLATIGDPVPTLILSAKAIPDNEKAKFPKNVAVLRKPVSSQMLMNKISEILEKEPDKTLALCSP